MASVHVYDTVKSALQAEFSGVYPVLDIDSIDATLEQGTDPFLVLEEVTSDEEASAFGDPAAVCMLESGSFLLHAFSPAPESLSAVRAIADALRAFLRNQIFDGVVLRSVTPCDPESLNDGIWSIGGVVFAYEYRFFVSLPPVATAAGAFSPS